jgi:sodium-dependent dicarboxylate transporter 2/3/5
MNNSKFNFELPDKITLSIPDKRKVSRKNLFNLGIGVFLFFVIIISPDWGGATEPNGEIFLLSFHGKLAIAITLLTAYWWITEPIPLGITSLVAALLQSFLLIRPSSEIFSDFMDPGVWFIFASMFIGMAFTRTALNERLAYTLVRFSGEKSINIYLGIFVLILLMTMVMAHTAVAAALFPLILTIYRLYDPENKNTKFGKGLFIGMAYVAGAGSIITLLGSARGAVAIDLLDKLTHGGFSISFSEYTYYLLPAGVIMMILIWIYISIVFRPERKSIPGLRQKVIKLRSRLGNFKRNEIYTILIIVFIFGILFLRSFIPFLKQFDKSSILLLSTVAFFVARILKLSDLEKMPWNIVLLFGGAISIGTCLWETGAANWIAIKWISLFKGSDWLLYTISISILVLIVTNFIMNVAAISIVIPITIVLSNYMGISPKIMIFATLVSAGMPFLLIPGAAPNVIAYSSRKFTASEFFFYGLPLSIILLGVVAFLVTVIWPLMGMDLIK